MLGSSYSDIMKAVGASDRVFEILNRRPKLVAPDMDEAAVEDVNYDCGCHKQHHPEISTGNIEFRDVDFSYAGRSDVKILNKCSLSVPGNSTVAICGTSGSGKSTISSLLTRLYDVDGDDDRSGIFIDGTKSKFSVTVFALQNWDCVSRTCAFCHFDH